MLSLCMVAHRHVIYSTLFGRGILWRASSSSYCTANSVVCQASEGACPCGSQAGRCTLTLSFEADPGPPLEALGASGVPSFSSAVFGARCHASRMSHLLRKESAPVSHVTTHFVRAPFPPPPFNPTSPSLPTSSTPFDRRCSLPFQLSAVT